MKNKFITKKFIGLEDIKQIIKIDETELKKLAKINRKYPVKVSPYFSKMIDWDNPRDPLRQIVFPSPKEENKEGSIDTSKERSITIMKGLQHAFRPTVLLLISSDCACNCRFCFRKRLKFSSEELLKSKKDIEKALNYIEEHREIDNILLSGGDPLMLSNKLLEIFLKELNKIEHIKIIRIGTCIPAYFPDRVNKDKRLKEMISMYCKKKKIYFVLHFNHPNELTESAYKCIDNLKKSGVNTLNQAVLLKGINDNPNVLSDLFNKLSYVGVTPYYLFQCRPVRNATHFQVSLGRGYKIFEEAKEQMSGLAKTARYVMSHKTGKIEIVGLKDNFIFLKYHQAINPHNLGRIFTWKINNKTTWLA